MTDHRLTAIDIALKPGDAMVRRARADNERLLKAFPEFFALDATHHPHMTMLQQFVRTAELGKVAAAANAILGKERVKGWRLKATGYYYIPSPPLGIAGIVVEPTEALHRLQRELLDAVAPFTERTGTPAAFLQHRRRARHPAGAYRLRRRFRRCGGRRQVQPARHDRRRAHGLSRQDVRRTVQGLHVLSRRRGGLPPRHFRRRPQGASDIDARALSAAAAVQRSPRRLARAPAIAIALILLVPAAAQAQGAQAMRRTVASRSRCGNDRRGNLA